MANPGVHHQERALLEVDAFVRRREHLHAIRTVGAVVQRGQLLADDQRNSGGHPVQLLQRDPVDHVRSVHLPPYCRWNRLIIIHYLKLIENYATCKFSGDLSPEK